MATVQLMIRNLNRTTKFFLGLAVQLAIVGLFLGGMHYLKQVSPNRDDAKLEEIKAELQTIPTYPGFVRVGESFTSRHMDASGALYFRSSANPGNVWNYYGTELTKRGWQRDEAIESIRFRKNDLQFSIEYRPDQSDWNYALGIDWEN